VAVRCRLEGGFQQHFLRSNSPETLVQGFKTLNKNILVNGLTTWNNVYQNHSLKLSQKTVAMTFPADRNSLKIAPSKKKLDYAMPLTIFCLRFKVMEPCFIPSDNL
jgi:hypothetical protein